MVPGPSRSVTARGAWGGGPRYGVRQRSGGHVVSSEVPTRRHMSPDEELERAMTDYLRISRGAHLYASGDEHQRAEEAAWDRLASARDLVEGAPAAS